MHFLYTASGTCLKWSDSEPPFVKQPHTHTHDFGYVACMPATLIIIINAGSSTVFEFQDAWVKMFDLDDGLKTCLTHFSQHPSSGAGHLLYHFILISTMSLEWPKGMLLKEGMGAKTRCITSDP